MSEKATEDFVQELKELESSEETLEHAIYSSCMVTNLINDLLDLAKFESNTFSFSFSYFDLIDTIDQVFNQVQFLAKQKGIQLKSTIKNVHQIQ